jgi:hypothetical protein
MKMSSVKLITGETFEVGQDEETPQGTITDIWMGDNQVVMIERNGKPTDIRIPYHAVSYYYKLVRAEQ